MKCDEISRVCVCLSVCSVANCWLDECNRCSGTHPNLGGSCRARTGTPMKSYSPWTLALAWLPACIAVCWRTVSERSVMDWWPITFPSTPPCLINLSTIFTHVKLPSRKKPIVGLSAFNARTAELSDNVTDCNSHSCVDSSSHPSKSRYLGLSSCSKFIAALKFL